MESRSEHANTGSKEHSLNNKHQTGRTPHLKTLKLWGPKKKGEDTVLSSTVNLCGILVNQIIKLKSLSFKLPNLNDGWGLPHTDWSN
jgi:hypothetical protein